jgi:protein phosphatase
MTIEMAVLILLIGAPGAGKSTWARTHFRAEDVVSSDALRAWVCGDPNNQQATPDAVALMHLAVAARMRFGLTTLVDATNAAADHRQQLLDLAEAVHRPAVAVVLDVPLVECLRRNARRSGSRRVPEAFVRVTHASIQQMLRAAGEQPPPGFAAAVLTRPDGTVRVTGHLPAACRDAAWATPPAATPHQ